MGADGPSTSALRCESEDFSEPDIYIIQCKDLWFCDSSPFVLREGTGVRANFPRTSRRCRHGSHNGWGYVPSLSLQTSPGMGGSALHVHWVDGGWQLVEIEHISGCEGYKLHTLFSYLSVVES